MEEENELPHHPSSTLKRKRTLTPSDNLISSQPLNPFNYPPGKLAQFRLAGLSEHEEDPTSHIKDFPHRGLDASPPSPASQLDTGTDAEDEDEDGDGDRDKDEHVDEAGRHIKTLRQAILIFLGRGETKKAARAFGIILQLRPFGAPVDVRKNDLWCLGAEILMHDGEKASSLASERSNSATNLDKVKAYYETLIQHHPYNLRRETTYSAFHFNLVLLNWEIHNIQTEYITALASLDKDLSSMNDDGADNIGEDGLGQAREEDLLGSRDRCRAKALASMQDITTRIDDLMREPPYSKEHDYLRLRAMVSLQLADLVIPLVKGSSTSMEEAERRRNKELGLARDLKKKMRHGDHRLERAIYPDEDDDRKGNDQKGIDHQGADHNGDDHSDDDYSEDDFSGDDHSAEDHSGGDYSGEDDEEDDDEDSDEDGDDENIYYEDDYFGEDYCEDNNYDEGDANGHHDEENDHDEPEGRPLHASLPIREG